MATNVSGTQITLGDSSTVTSAATTVGATTARSGETYTGRRGGGIYEFDTNVPSTTDGSVEPNSGQLYFNNGTAAKARFSSIEGVAIDRDGNIIVADTDNNLIRKIDTNGVVTTIAGSGNYGSNNGTGTAASFSFPEGVAIDSNGNIIDKKNHSVATSATPTRMYPLHLNYLYSIH